ncbi:hypothetical protein RF11_16200 [Thelohanellus kitauei]|uniref:Uncharacterized protein n=1 Tax=Thelohanellus kitauei TaxID=669202 RepID=A0A0C2NE56_THEKT|nr:hypothetical protein RF11_16200 [Thelohanellus kitauei]
MINNDIVSVIFGNIHQISIEELAKRVIVAPKNSQTLNMNRKIIDLIPGNAQIYYSADSIISEDPNNTLKFPSLKSLKKISSKRKSFRSATEETVLIPRIDLAPAETTLTFTLRQQQFPVVPAYAITINNGQGQSFDHVGIHLQTNAFSHGQLYVMLSRSRNSRRVKMRIELNNQQGQFLNAYQF